jgi:hypothetical protein
LLTQRHAGLIKITAARVESEPAEGGGQRRDMTAFLINVNVTERIVTQISEGLRLTGIARPRGCQMVRSKNSGVLATIKYPVTVEVSVPEFEALDAIRHLDVKALAKSARAEIGLGYINSCCGRQLVRAVIRRGMVTGLRVDEPPKKDRTPVPPELAKLLREARNAAVRRRGRPPKFPIPVENFFSTGVAYDIICVQTLQCIRICFVFGLLKPFCTTCCWRTDEPGQEPICGLVTIDTTASG